MKHRHFWARRRGLMEAVYAASAARRDRLLSLIVRDNGRCRWCGCGVRVVKLGPNERPPSDQATEDHIITKAMGGSDDLANLLLACWSCNNDRGGLSVEEYTQLRAVRAGLECEALPA